MTRTFLALATTLLLFGPSRVQAQLTLRDALARADRQAYANRIAGANADVQRAQAIQPYRGILPGLRAEAGFIRTNDPLNAFGTKLRQRAVTPADFAPALLNSPGGIGNRSTALVLEQPLLNADAWVGRAAAGDAAKAQSAMADWTRMGTRTDVVRAYFGATLAAEKRATLEAAERAGLAHVARARALADTGLVTRSDALLAEVRAGEITTQKLGAAGEASHAGRALAMLLGEPGAAYELPAALPSADAIRALVAGDTAEGAAGPTAADRVAVDSRQRTHAGIPQRADVRADMRADVRAAAFARSAARADAWRARSLYLPRLNGFARYDWNDNSGFFADRRSWTAGVMASWSPFAGASEIAETRATRARSRAAEAQHEAATANARLEQERTREALAVTLAQLAIAERAVEQSAEALRIVARKYDGGLATISDLLEAQAVETQSRLGLSFARYQLLVAAAERRQALGSDPSFLAALDGAAAPSNPGAATGGPTGSPTLDR